MVEHLVLFKFSNETVEEKKEVAIKKLQNLKNDIPGIEDLQCNKNFSNRNKGYDVGLRVRFVNKDALAGYGPHSKHQEAVEYMKMIGLEDLIVVDFEVS